MDTSTKLQHAALLLPLFLIFLSACQQPSSTAKQDGQLYANTQFPGLSIRYTRDGSDPVLDSEEFSAPVKVNEEVRAGTFSSSGRSSRILIESL